MSRHRRIGLALAGVLLATLAWRPPAADIRILAHDRLDPTPRQIRAALDLGLMAVSVLVTWSGPA